VVHSRDVEDCVGAPWRKSTLKLAKIPYITMWQYWLGNTKPKKAFRLNLNAFKKLLLNFEKNLFNKIFYWLTNCPMPSDSRNSTMAKATGLIFFTVRHRPRGAFCHSAVHTVHSSWTYHSPPFLPFIFVHHEKCQFSGRYGKAYIKSSIIFIVATLITKVLFKQLLIRTA